MAPRWQRRVPLLGLLRAYPRDLLRGDVAAGLTTAVMLIPQAMAYASLAGMPPITGLYASLVPVVVYGLLGTSGALAFGPVAIIALLTASTVGPLSGGDPTTYVALASALALLVGVIQLLLGFLRLGVVVDLLSHSVVSGFTSAAALVIAASQLPELTGIDTGNGQTFIAEIGALVGARDGLHLTTLLVGGTAVAGLAALKRLRTRVPGPLVVVGLLTAAAYVLDLPAAGVSILGQVPAGLPAPQLPAVGPAQLQQLVVPALIIALLAYMEGISVAKAIAARTHERVDASQELIASGAANLAAGAFQAFPVAGGFSRTAVNHEAGARTPVAGLVTAATVTVALLLFTPLFTYLPDAVLAAIVIIAVVGLVDLRTARRTWRVDRWDFSMLAVTFTATLTLGVEIGLAVGIVTSLLLLVARTARPHIVEIGHVPGTGIYRNVHRYPTETDPGILLVRIDAALLFATAPTVVRRVEALTATRDERLRAVVLDASAISDVDSDGLHTLDELERTLSVRSVGLHLATVRGPVRDLLRSAGHWQRWQAEGRIHETVEEALVALRAQT